MIASNVYYYENNTLMNTMTVALLLKEELTFQSFVHYECWNKKRGILAHDFCWLFVWFFLFVFFCLFFLFCLFVVFV
jgi:hypothetical protein